MCSLCSKEMKSGLVHGFIISSFHFGMNGNLVGFHIE